MLDITLFLVSYRTLFSCTIYYFYLLLFTVSNWWSSVTVIFLDINYLWFHLYFVTLLNSWLTVYINDFLVTISYPRFTIHDFIFTISYSRFFNHDFLITISHSWFIFYDFLFPPAHRRYAETMTYVTIPRIFPTLFISC